MKRQAVFALLLALFTPSAVFAQAQAANGNIERTIRDTSGAVLSGVTVTVLNRATGAQRVVVTDQSGYKVYF